MVKKDRPKLGEQIRSYRESAGMTQEDLSAAAKVPVNSLSDWERGVRTPRLESLIDIAESLRVGLDDLVYRSPAEAALARGDASKVLERVLQRAISNLEVATKTPDPAEAARMATETLGYMRYATADATVPTPERPSDG